jgi:purine-binding chemotaxis protein CheW
MSEHAIVPRPRAQAETLREFLAFDVGGELHALPLGCVREILRIPEVTEVPRSAPDVLGVISVRGTVTTLFDLRRKLRLREPTLGPKTRVLLVDSGHEVCGLLVDNVRQVYRLREGEIEATAALGGHVPAYLAGIGRPGSVGQAETTSPPREVLVLLDPAALLEAP